MRRCKYNNENQPLLSENECTNNTRKYSFSNYFGILCWSWIYPVILLAYRRELTENDLDSISDIDKTHILLGRLNTYDWLSTTTWRIVMNEFWKEYISTSLTIIPYLIICVSQPLILHQLMLTMMKTRSLNAVGYTCLVLVFVTLFVRPFFSKQCIFHPLRIGIRIRNALMIIIYRRALSLKLFCALQMNIGQITNMIANDTAKFEEICQYLVNLSEGFAETIIMFSVLCWMIHPLPVLFIFILLLLFIGVQLYFSRRFCHHRETTAEYTDRRIQTLTEFIHGYYSAKIYNWEKSIDDHITKARNAEIESIRRACRLRAFNLTQYFSSTSILALFTFGTAWLLGYQLNAANTFPVLVSFCSIRNNFVSQLQFACEKLGEMRSASKRIDELMSRLINQEHRSPLVQSSIDQERKGSISMVNATLSWNHEIPSLSSLNLIIEKGTFVGIVGSVGSGKSSLLAALFGEMNLIEGQINTNHSSFAYAAQTPWIFADTIRNNILLNRPFDEEQYHKVVYACCLDVDLHLIGSAGDLTVIGDNGVNLSGGQKARIALARALYADADIYLLDDPFAAVDRLVAKQIYQRCVGEEGLLKNKTRLLVTHQTQFVSHAQKIIFLVNGRINDQGSLDVMTIEDNKMKNDETSFLTDMLDINPLTDDTQPIIVDESSKYVISRWNLWYEWFTAPPLGIFGFGLLIVLLLIGEGLSDASNYWLNIWLQRLEHNKSVSSIFAYIYFALIIGTIFFDIIRTNYYYFIALNGSNAFHNNMKKGLLYTCIQFFESNPAGRIVNRASKDQSILDESLPTLMLSGTILTLIVIGAACNICLALPWMLILFVALAPMVWLVICFYQKSSRQLKKLESITRSPIYGLFSTSMHGVSTIRAFRAETSFTELMCNRMDINTSVYINAQAASQWFTIVLSNMCLPIFLATCIYVALFQHRMDSSTVGFTLTSAFNLLLTFQWAIRRFTEVDILMTSAERICEYARLPREEDADRDTTFDKTLFQRPKSGTIEFKNYSLRHRSNLDYVIKNLNLSIEPGQKVGIIGRTGAGKSSLFKGIFRFIDRSNTEGQILIDDIDINSITLNDLRSHLSLIPQQPILFSGSLRYNLDPCNLYSDEECWKAIEDAQLKSFVMESPDGLLMTVAEFGNNLSVGQCQLISIARALMRKSKILLIDEATASVDQETDNLIQTILKKTLNDRTILTIAHRLQTVYECDRILVLDNGMMTHYDIPKNIF